MSWPIFVSKRIREKFSSKKLVDIMGRVRERNNISYEEVYDHAHDLELKLGTARCHINNLLGLLEQVRDLDFGNNDNGKFIKGNALTFLKETKL